MVKSMIEGSEKKVERKNRLIGENIDQQEKDLLRRLEKRSRSKSQKKKNIPIVIPDD